MNPDPLPGKYLLEKYRGTLTEAVSLTIEHKIEHGFSVAGVGGQSSMVGIYSGEEEFIQHQWASLPTPIGIRVHTHTATPTTSFSSGDWRSFLGDVAQYPTLRLDHPTWVRSSCVAAQRPEEVDSFGLKCAYVDSPGLRLDGEQQNEWIRRARSKLDNIPLDAPDRDERMGEIPEIGIETRTVEIR